MCKVKSSHIKSLFSREISFAKNNLFDAILLPLEDDYDPYYLDADLELDEVIDVAEDLGWDRFYYINFSSKFEKVIDLYELEVA